VIAGTSISSILAYKYISKGFENQAQAADTTQKAVCILRGEPGYETISGVVKFSQTSADKVVIEGEVNGLAKGKHGFHIHQLGDLTQGCTSAGPHYNPFNKEHGGPTDKERHIGDLGNLDSDGKKATFKLEDSLVKLVGDTSVIGRSVVVHVNEDDYGKGGFPDSKTTGHAGGRVACGVIGRASN